MRVVNDSLNGCQSPSVTEPQRDRCRACEADEVAPLGFRITTNRSRNIHIIKTALSSTLNKQIKQNFRGVCLDILRELEIEEKDVAW